MCISFFFLEEEDHQRQQTRGPKKNNNKEGVQTKIKKNRMLSSRSMGPRLALNPVILGRKKTQLTRFDPHPTSLPSPRAF